MPSWLKSILSLPDPAYCLFNMCFDAHNCTCGIYFFVSIVIGHWYICIFLCSKKL